MSNKIAIINAFDPEDFFIELLSRQYDNAIAENGMVSELFFVNSMFFSFTPFPESYTFDTLEPDLQRCVQSVRQASTVAIFTSFHTRGEINPAFAQFVNRIFHLSAGAPNKQIWGETTSIYNKRVRIISVIDDPKTWGQYKYKRNASMLPIHKINFRLFGFGEVYTSTLGYLNDNIVNEYGEKALRKMTELGMHDALRKQ